MNKLGGISQWCHMAIVAAGVLVTSLSGVVGAVRSPPAAVVHSQVLSSSPAGTGTATTEGKSLAMNFAYGDQRQSVHRDSSALAADTRPSGQALRTNERTGKIYLRMFLKIKDPQAKKEFVEGIFVVDPETGAWRSLLDHGHSPRVSPDGRRLAVIRYDWQLDANGKRFRSVDHDANYRIEIMDADGGNRRRLELQGAELEADVLELSSPDWR